MTQGFIKYKNEVGYRASSADTTDNGERIRKFNAAKRLEELNKNRGKLSLLAYEKAM